MDAIMLKKKIKINFNFDILYKRKKLKNVQIILGSENKRKNDGIG